MAVSAFKRVLVTLDNQQAIYIYNADNSADVSTSIILSGKPVVVEQDNGSSIYKFNSADTGWFGSIRSDDSDRMDNVMQLGEDILIKVSPLKSYTIKDYAKATKFVGGN